MISLPLPKHRHSTPTAFALFDEVGRIEVFVDVEKRLLLEQLKGTFPSDWVHDDHRFLLKLRDCVETNTSSSLRDVKHCIGEFIPSESFDIDLFPTNVNRAIIGRLWWGGPLKKLFRYNSHLFSVRQTNRKSCIPNRFLRWSGPPDFFAVLDNGGRLEFPFVFGRGLARDFISRPIQDLILTPSDRSEVHYYVTRMVNGDPPRRFLVETIFRRKVQFNIKRNLFDDGLFVWGKFR